jgi:hypothetical protein
MAELLIAEDAMLDLSDTLIAARIDHDPMGRPLDHDDFFDSTIR